MNAFREDAELPQMEVPLFIEYNSNETRGRCFLGSAAMKLCLFNDIKKREDRGTLTSIIQFTEMKNWLKHWR